MLLCGSGQGTKEYTNGCERESRGEQGVTSLGDTLVTYHKLLVTSVINTPGGSCKIC